MTRFMILGAWIFALAFSAFADDKKDVPKELEPFQGDWKLVKAEQNGKDMDKNLQVTFKGEKWNSRATIRAPGPSR